jgi:ABC-2 type transport system permease protein
MLHSSKFRCIATEPMVSQFSLNYVTNLAERTQGILISTLCSTQQQAFATNFFVINPLFTLSGFSFPISSMPDVLQWLTYLNPLRYFLIVIRGTFLKGIGVGILWPDLLAMAAIAAVLLAVSILRFRKSLE